MRIRLICGAAALLAASVGAGTAEAQTTHVSGTVAMKHGDDEALPAPVRGATVDIYRTDMKSEYHTRTASDGRYVMAGLPFIGTYTLIVSAPGARPTLFSGCRFASDPELNVVLEPGDGNRPALEDAFAEPVQSCIRGARTDKLEPATGAPVAAFATPSPIDLAALFAAGRLDDTLSEGRKILVVTPDEIEANLHVGLVLFIRGDEAEGALHLRRFLAGAADTHPGRAGASAMLDDYLSRTPAVVEVAQPPKPSRRRR